MGFKRKKAFRTSSNSRFWGWRPVDRLSILTFSILSGFAQYFFLDWNGIRGSICGSYQKMINAYYLGAPTMLFRASIDQPLCTPNILKPFVPLLEPRAVSLSVQQARVRLVRRPTVSIHLSIPGTATFSTVQPIH